MVVFVVETSETDDFATRRNFTLEMVHLGAFSMAKEAAVRGHAPPFLHPAKYHSGTANIRKHSFLHWNHLAGIPSQNIYEHLQPLSVISSAR